MPCTFTRPVTNKTKIVAMSRPSTPPPPPLHAEDCQGRAEDVAAMSERFNMDPENYREVELQSFSDVLCLGHVECLRFFVHHVCLNYPFYKSWALGRLLLHMMELNPMNNMENLEIFTDYFEGEFGCYGHEAMLMLCMFHGTMTIFSLYLNSKNCRITLRVSPELEIQNEYTNISVNAVQQSYPEALCLLLRHGEPLDFQQLIQQDSCTLSDQTISPVARQHLSLIHHFVRSISHVEKIDLQTLEILYQFGANLWEKDAEGRLPLKVLEEGMEFEDHVIQRWRLTPVSEKGRQVLCARIKQLMSRPLDLKSQCRLAIKRAMGVNYVTRLEQLPRLPRTVLAFLRFKGLEDVV